MGTQMSDYEEEKPPPVKEDFSCQMDTEILPKSKAKKPLK